MSELSPNSLSIKEFPDDVFERVVWLYGAVSKNKSNSLQTRVDIALRQILSNGELGEAIVLKVGVAQLDIVRIGSIWKGQVYTGKKWHNYEKEQFKFKFASSPIESIRFLSKKTDNSNFYLIPNFKYPLSLPNKSDYWKRFADSQVTKLKATDGTTVLIPALELLTRTYTPRSQEIRCDLISYSINDVLHKHIVLDKCKGNLNGVYNLRLDANKHQSNVTFLSYLLYNKKTQVRVSKICNLAVEQRFPNGEINQYKHPVVLPYQPKSLRLNVEGIRLDDNFFLVLRIIKTSLPVEHDIQVEYMDNTNHSNHGGNQGEINIPSQRIVNNNLPITGEYEPGVNSGHAYIVSDIEFFPEEPKINTTVIATTSENNARRNYYERTTPTLLSSGEKSYSDESKNIAKLRQSEYEPEVLEEINEKSQSMVLINNALLQLMNNKNSLISSLKYIDNNGIEFDGFKLIVFPKQLFREKGIGKWPAYKFSSREKLYNKIQYKICPRKVLLLKIRLTKSNKIIYLLEIERRPAESGFCGLIFTISESILSKERLNKLLKKIASNKGKLRIRKSKKLVNIELPVLNEYVFEHSSIENKVVEKMERVIKKAEEKFFSNL